MDHPTAKLKPRSFREYIAHSFALRADNCNEELIHLRALIKKYVCMFCEKGFQDRPGDTRCNNCEYAICSDCIYLNRYEIISSSYCPKCVNNYRYGNGRTSKRVEYCIKCAESKPSLKPICTSCQCSNVTWYIECVCGNTHCRRCLNDYDTTLKN